MTDLQAAKAAVRALYGDLDTCAPGAEATTLAKHVTDDYRWRGFHPFNEMTGADEVAAIFWQPLRAALRPMQRRMDMFIAGHNSLDDQATTWVASMGHLTGLLDAKWLCIPPTGKLAMLRYAEFHRVTEDGKIAETAMYFDIPHLMMQAGLQPFPPQTAAHLVQPGPIGNDALLFGETDPAEGQKTLDTINHMIGDISKWSGGQSESLEDELRRSWVEDMMWWGPAGIGATYTIERYAKQHSGPFREAFAHKRVFNGHVAKIAEGNFGGFFGWPNLTLYHEGGFMGMPATGKPGDMRVIDMYSRRGDKLFENWIFIDLLHFWNMQGLDILARMEQHPRT